MQHVRKFGRGRDGGRNGERERERELSEMRRSDRAPHSYGVTEMPKIGTALHCTHISGCRARPLHGEWEAAEAEEEANCGEDNGAIHSLYVDS